jgi:hypothetical protein
MWFGLYCVQTALKKHGQKMQHAVETNQRPPPPLPVSVHSA